MSFKNYLSENEEIQQKADTDELITKDDIIELLDELSEEDIDDLGNFILDEVYDDEDIEEVSVSELAIGDVIVIEDEELTIDTISETEINYTSTDDEGNSITDYIEIDEKKFFKKKKRDLNRAKKQDRTSRRKRARELKKYYKKNKSKIKVKAARYRKKTKRNPNLVRTHRK